MLGFGQAQGGIEGAAGDLGAGEGQEDLVHLLRPLGALAPPAPAGYQVAAGEAEQKGEANEKVLDHPGSSLPPRWATIRTSTPPGVALIRRCGSGSRSRLRPLRGSDSPTIR